MLPRFSTITRWPSRGVSSCAASRAPQSWLLPGAAVRWQYGVARYSGGELRWYRSLGFGTRPNRVLQRREVTVLGRRSPLPAEKQSLPATAIVVQCRDGEQDLSLALGESAYTGFVSWLEASAPMA